MAAAVAVAIPGGVLIGTPPWSILGAAVLVGASILFSVGATWTFRRSWQEPWPPDATPTVRQQIRRLTVLNTVANVLIVALVAMAAYAIAELDWGRLAIAVILMLTNLFNLSLRRRALAQLRAQHAAEGHPLESAGDAVTGGSTP